MSPISGIGFETCNFLQDGLITPFDEGVCFSNTRMRFQIPLTKGVTRSSYVKSCTITLISSTYKVADNMANSVLLCFVILTTLLASATCNLEGDALSAWKSMLIDPNNVLQSWDATLVNPCTWFHVTCNNNNSVTRIDLGNAGLSGSLVPQLGQLSNLQYLEVYGNELAGSIPMELGNLTQLISLDLRNNNLTGVIPSTLGFLSSLKWMRLDGNSFSGEIPLEIGNLTSLIQLDLHLNFLSGSIPDSLGNFSLLIPLSFSNLSTNPLPSGVYRAAKQLPLTGRGSMLLETMLVNGEILDTNPIDRSFDRL
ncbi:uncharacterized protein [Phyllobates terribilis]|uniref:uncharacterized protein n=1 Tax=Phyllobates terribilis TaxID=111132 RepID=UPI003CCAC753